MKASTDTYLWGCNIGEGAFARVVHARRKLAPGVGVFVARASEADVRANAARAPSRDAATILTLSEDGETATVKFASSNNRGGDEADAADTAEGEDEGTSVSVSSLEVAEHLAIKIMEKLHIINNNKVEYVKQEKTILARLSGSPGWCASARRSRTPTTSTWPCPSPTAASCSSSSRAGGPSSRRSRRRRRRRRRRSAQSVDAALSQPEARFYLAEVVAALRFLREGRCAPGPQAENILVSGSGHLRLTDFGTALDLTGGGDGGDGGVSERKR